MILLEVPIIDVTEEINNSESIVYTVYNIIVGKHNIEVIDCLSGNYLFCTRVFEKKKHTKLFNFYAEDVEPHNHFLEMWSCFEKMKKKIL